MLSFLETRHVLVLHCRGKNGDDGTVANLKLLALLRLSVERNQFIHLHCFTGNVYVLNRWLEFFPNTFFGFTDRKSTAAQVEALKLVEKNKLLSESDAPYFPKTYGGVSTPGSLYQVARTVANLLGLTPENVLGLTLEHTQ